jgi:hypothetical protein
MSFLIDLVHHNPGETPFKTDFTNPRSLAELGYSGQVFKHVNCAVRFDTLGRNDFKTGSPAGDWMDAMRRSIAGQICAAKAAGLQVFYHIDLFILPRALVQDEAEAICNSNKKISLDCPRTQEIHRALFNEIFRDFPQIDGLIVRVGETYLFDTPHHCGNTAVPLHGEGINPEWSQQQYVKLLHFLREEICVRHDRMLIQRTWDIFNDRFHSDPNFYLAVAEKVPPHPKFLFSIKHTALDFFRRVKVNPSLGLGHHPQIIEVQCQREYEGKGAFPCYIGHMISEGFPENKKPVGLGTLLQRPNIRGVFTWSRGGGWFGPYLKNEFWCRLNVHVISVLTQNPLKPEPEIFADFCRDTMRMDEASTGAFRKACELSSQALLLGRYCAAYDAQWQETTIPTELWMRDDRLGGMEQLKPVFRYLHEHSETAAAIAEKWESVRLWKEALKEFDAVVIPDLSLRNAIDTSFRYAINLFEIIALGWEILAVDFAANYGSALNRNRLCALHARYAAAWEAYLALEESAPDCASLFRGDFWNWPGKPALPGLDASVANAMCHLDETHARVGTIAAGPVEKTWFGVGVDGAR